LPKAKDFSFANIPVISPQILFEIPFKNMHFNPFPLSSWLLAIYLKMVSVLIGIPHFTSMRTGPDSKPGLAVTMKAKFLLFSFHPHFLQYFFF
jgi:hypothetical protein